MNLSKQRLTQLLIFAQIENDIQTREYNNMLAHYMPEIVLNKKEKDIEIWKDIIDIINFFLEAETDFVPEVAPKELENDMVNSPSHYTKGQYEVIDVIKDWLTPEEFRGYIKGNTIKYVSRERYKNGDEDLFKTIFYLNYLMNHKKSDGRKE